MPLTHLSLAVCANSECSHQGKSNPNCGFIAFSSGPSAPLGLGLEDHFFEFSADVNMYQLGNRPLSVISSFRNLWFGRAIESRTNIRASVCIHTPMPPCTSVSKMRASHLRSNNVHKTYAQGDRAWDVLPRIH